MGWSARSWPPFVLVALLGCPNSRTIVVDDDGPSGYAEAMVADVSWSLHPQFGSLVVVSWEQLAPATAWVEASVDEGHWLASPAQAVDEGGCSDLVLGIPFGTLASLRVANDFGEGPLYAPAVTDRKSVV